MSEILKVSMSSLSLQQAHVSSTHLQQVNGVHDRVFGDTGKGTSSHVGRQTEVRRQTLVAVVASSSIGPFLSQKRIRKGSLVFILLLVEDHFLLHGHVSDRRGESLGIQDGRVVERKRERRLCVYARDNSCLLVYAAKPVTACGSFAKGS